MALIKCEECGTEISNRAQQCVKCGCPVKNDALVKVVSNEEISIGIPSAPIPYIAKSKNFKQKLLAESGKI